MSLEMLINVSEGEECRIALIDDGRLEELYMERSSFASHVGNIYKGRVTNVEPSIQAAFIDFGLGRNGFLHISDLMPTYFGGPGEDVQETVGRKMARRDRPPIQRCLRRGDDIVVQIIKEGIGTKGPTLSTYLAIPGRILVMMPGMAKMGVSRKIEDDEERRRLRQILDSLEPIDDVGFIIRTAGVGKTKAEILRDLTYLTRLWQNFAKKRDSGPGPMELYTEGDLVSRTVRDVFTNDVERIIVDNKDVAKRVKEVVKLANPRTRNKVEQYEEAVPLFHKFGIESQIELMHSRHVPLPSGGSLVIDSTEAIVAIDVNSGKFREHSDAETTAFRTDMEAADEIPRQLRLRDLGGVIICDFIDLRYERHRRELEQRLHDNFQKDRAKTRVLRMSQFGIIEITRQRMRPSLKRSIYFDCPHCKGAGLIKTPESMSLDVMRRLAIATNDARVARVELAVFPDAAFYLQNKKRQSIAELESRFNKPIVIKSDASLGLDEAKLVLHDARDGQVYLAELGMTPQPPAGALPPPSRRSGGRHDGRHDNRNDERGRRQGGPPQRHGPPPRRDDEDSHSIDRVEHDVEEREEQIEREPDQPSLTEETGDSTLPSRPAAVPTDFDGPDAGGPESGASHDAPHDTPRDGPRDGPHDGSGQSDSFGANDDGGHRRHRRRRRRGRGGNGGGNSGGSGGGSNDFAPRQFDSNRNRPPNQNRPFTPHRDHHLEGQEQAVHSGFVEEYDTGPVDQRPPRPAQPPTAVPPAPRGNQAPPQIGNQAPNQPGNQSGGGFDDDGNPRRRRRRRRGGRGRNRGTNRNDGPRMDGPAGERDGNQRLPEHDDHDDHDDHDAPAGRDRRPPPPPVVRQAPPPPPPQLPPPPPPAPEPAVVEGRKPAGKAPRRRATTARRKPPSAKTAAIQATVVRTGSADKHLASDDPVAPQPASRPRSFSDLDQIPDDFD